MPAKFGNRRSGLEALIIIIRPDSVHFDLFRAGKYENEAAVPLHRFLTEGEFDGCSTATCIKPAEARPGQKSRSRIALPARPEIVSLFLLLHSRAPGNPRIVARLSLHVAFGSLFASVESGLPTLLQGPGIPIALPNRRSLSRRHDSLFLACHCGLWKMAIA